jgi:hypothetical protein
VTLTGTVEYGGQRESAVNTVAGLTGVRNVINEIEISYDADPIDVTLLVQDALDRNALISDDSDVVVDTKGNTVTLVAISAGFGSPRATAVLAVLGYRAVNYWLPLIPGGVAYLRLRLKRGDNNSSERAGSTP